MSRLPVPSRPTSPTTRAAARRRYDPLQLVELTRFVAAEVEAGLYPFVDFDAEFRWHQRIYLDPLVDVWLISWLPAQGTQLHDHGGSAGSFTVVRGELAEAVVTPAARSAAAPVRLRERTHRPGRSVGFDARYVHDVRNLGAEPAVSVHAYARPLTAMTYYDLDDDGRLVPLATLATTDPEPEFDPAASTAPAIGRAS